ncbi:MAG TPA: BsuPI-related putative proteinase inhibitor [Gammaproteobacteria bacterium]|nr:BsuPI-related putative proteinase inhibitor [Gammaproteobacteria bacterium]
MKGTRGQRRATKLGYAATLALASMALVACDGGSSAEQNAACGIFRTELTVKDRMSQGVDIFNPGEAVTFELAITNTSNAPATLTAGSSCSAVVFEVFDSTKQRLWGNADGIACLMMLQARTYAPLETVRESSTWDQRASGGAQVPTGSYTVIADVGQYAPAVGQLVDCRARLSKSAQLAIH